MSQRRIEFLFSILVVVLLGWVLWEARAWPLHSRIFPWSIGAVVLVLALAQLLASGRRVIHSGPSAGFDGSDRESPEARRTQATSPEDAALADSSVHRRAVAICGWILVFFLGVWLLGFRVGAFLLTAAFLRLGAAESWGVSLAAGAISYLFFLIVFHLLLQAPLPSGVLAESLGMDSLDDYFILRFRNLWG